jgi:hypothetical protein
MHIPYSIRIQYAIKYVHHLLRMILIIPYPFLIIVLVVGTKKE